MANVQEQGFRFVQRGADFIWTHPLELQACDVDCSDMTDAEFEAYVYGNFQFVECPYGACIASSALPVWIVEYPKTDDRARFFQAYKTPGCTLPGVQTCKGGVDNKRIGTERGFPTLGAVVLAAFNAVGSAA